MISDFRAIRLRILRGVKGERKRLKFSKQSKAGKGEEKKNIKIKPQAVIALATSRV